MLAALLAFGIVILLGTGMGLMFSAINVMYRDWTRVVQIFTQMLPFSVPMMYPYTLVQDRFEDFPIIAHLYLFNPITEAVLLMQRAFWITTVSPEDAAEAGQEFGFQAGLAVNFPPHLFLRGADLARALDRVPGVRPVGVQQAGRQDPGQARLMATSIEVENVSKQFSMRYQRTLKQVVVAKLRGQKTKDDFWALQDVSFTVGQGEAIGLMGLNGSGKSTLLKHIMGVMRPTSGQVRTRGRISGLIATGAGFHPEMTGTREHLHERRHPRHDQGGDGREVRRHRRLRGRRRRSWTPRSATTRRACSPGSASPWPCNVDCDVFIADEVLAVGDQPFKKKCMKKMEEIRDSGVTLFYVSHAAQSVRKMCTRVIVLEKGVVGFDGDVDEGIKYLHYDDDEPDIDEEEQNPDAELGSEI